jgi:hypothetical protein
MVSRMIVKFPVVIGKLGDSNRCVARFRAPASTLFVRFVVARLRSSAFRHTGGVQFMPQGDRDILIHRTRMSLLLLHTQLRQEVEDDAGLYF